MRCVFLRSAPLSAESHTAYRPVRFTSNIVMSSSLHLGSINNFRLEIVFAGLSDMAPRKRLSGLFPEIESVNPSVNRRRVPPKGTIAAPASYSAPLSNPIGMPVASSDVADPLQNTIGELC